MSETRTDEQMAEYVRGHRCYNAAPAVSIADWDRGVKAIEAEAQAAPDDPLDAAVIAAALDRLTREHLSNGGTSWGEWSSTERFAEAICAAAVRARRDARAGS